MKIPKHRNTETPKHRESEAFFTLSKQKLASQLKILTDLNLKVSYSYKTNRQIGDILQNLNQERELRAQHSKPTTNDQRPTNPPFPIPHSPSLLPSPDQRPTTNDKRIPLYGLGLPRPLSYFRYSGILINH